MVLHVRMVYAPDHCCAVVSWSWHHGQATIAGHCRGMGYQRHLSAIAAPEATLSSGIHIYVPG